MMSDERRTSRSTNGDTGAPASRLARLTKDADVQQLGSFVGLTFVVSWAFWIPSAAMFGQAASAGSPFDSPLFVAFQTAGAAGPSVAAWWLLRRHEGQEAANRIVERYKRWKVGVRWYVVALLLVPSIQLLVLAGDALIGTDPIAGPGTPLGDMLADLGVAGAIAVFPLSLLGQLPSSPLLEEFGWRGYALPRMQERFDALTSSLLLGLVWGSWHLPLVLAYGEQPAPYMVQIVALTVLLTWVYNNTNGSMLLALIFHASMNASLVPLTGSIGPWPLALTSAAAAAAVTATVGRENLSRATRRFSER